MFRCLRRTLLPYTNRKIAMPEPAQPLPAKVAEALQRGNILDAIKLLRDSKGVGLKQAREALDQYMRGNPVNKASPAAFPTKLPPSVVQAMQAGNKIEAIKLMRAQTGLSLKEAKDAVDRCQAQTQQLYGAGSPGEVPRSQGLFGWVVAAAAVALAAWYFLRGSAWV